MNEILVEEVSNAIDVVLVLEDASELTNALSVSIFLRLLGGVQVWLRVAGARVEPDFAPGCFIPAADPPDWLACAVGYSSRSADIGSILVARRAGM